MTYTISVEPSRTPGKVTATSTDGHTFTALEPLLQALATGKPKAHHPALLSSLAGHLAPDIGHCVAPSATPLSSLSA